MHRLDDYNGFSSYLNIFVRRLEEVYAADSLTFDEKIRAREEILSKDRRSFEDATADHPEAFRLVISFVNRPVNNAIILARVRYFHRLWSFSRLLEDQDGDLSRAIDFLKQGVDTVDDPFDLLPPRSRHHHSGIVLTPTPLLKPGSEREKPTALIHLRYLNLPGGKREKSTALLHRRYPSLPFAAPVEPDSTPG